MERVTTSIQICFRDIFSNIFFDQDRIDTQAGVELDFIDGHQIGRIRDPDKQAGAALNQRNGVMGDNEIVGDQIFWEQLNIEPVQVKKGLSLFHIIRSNQILCLNGRRPS